MNSTQKYFVDVLGAFLNQSSCPATPDGINWQEFTRLCKIHAVTGMVGHTLSAAQGVPAEVSAHLKKKTLATVMVSSAHTALGDKLLENMRAKGILCVPFKGAIIKQYYPVSELRTFSDIDILVPEDRFEEAHSAAMEMGFEHTDGQVGVRGYKKDGFHFEIHTTLAGDMTDLSKSEADFFAQAAENIKDSATLGAEYHFAYCLWHLTKHLSSSGAGVRMFMDIAILVMHSGIKDWDKVLCYLDMLGITQAAESILWLCRRWFGTSLPEPFTWDTDEDTALAMEEYVITAGTFGFSARSTGSSRLRNEMSADGKVSKAKVILKMFFPNTDYMAKQYPWYSGAKLLLPFMWVYRWFNILFARRKNSLKSLGDVAHGGEKELAEARLLDKTGWNIYSKK